MCDKCVIEQQAERIAELEGEVRRYRFALKKMIPRVEAGRMTFVVDEREGIEDGGE